jgi:hypothetical protein
VIVHNRPVSQGREGVAYYGKPVPVSVSASSPSVVAVDCESKKGHPSRLSQIGPFPKSKRLVRADVKPASPSLVPFASNGRIVSKARVVQLFVRVRNQPGHP